MTAVCIYTGKDSDRLGLQSESNRFMQPVRAADLGEMIDTRRPSLAAAPSVKRFMRFGREFMRFGRDARRDVLQTGRNGLQLKL